MNKKVINLVAVVGGASCISADDGQKVHDAILAELKQGNKVQLSFAGVEDLTTAFLNVAVGQLYGELDEAILKEQMLPPVDASEVNLGRLKRAVDWAKLFFANPARLKRVVQDARGHSDEPE